MVMQNCTYSDSNSSSTQLKSAITHVKLGWPVFPVYGPLAADKCSCRQSPCNSVAKHPMTRRGFRDACTSIDKVERLWASHPQANIGIATGFESGIVVIDIDPRHGGDESWRELEAKHGPTPLTRKVRTGGDGWHYYFRHPGYKCSNRVNLFDGIDLRGDGGYIIAPGSVHRSLKPYVLEDDAPVADLPEWLEQVLQTPKKVTALPTVATTPSKTTVGGRNNLLTSLSGFLHSRGLQRSEIEQAMLGFNASLCHPPLEKQEVMAVVASVGRYERPMWGEMIPLPEEKASPSMTPDLLPRGLREWAVDCSERMQVPLEYLAAPAMVVLSGLIGRKMVIKPKRYDSWSVVPNLWGMLVAPPGSMKSPALAAALEPVIRLAKKASKLHQDELQSFRQIEVNAKTEIDALRENLKAAHKQGHSDEATAIGIKLQQAVARLEAGGQVVEKRYLTQDTTVEKLLMIMKENPQGIMLFRDELSGWLETMHKPGREGDREFYLECWNGDGSYGMDRVGRGSIFVEGLCLSVFGGMQPGKFEAYLKTIAKGGRGDDGFLQRFQLLFYPKKQGSYKAVDREPNQQALDAFSAIIDAIDRLPLGFDSEGRLQRSHLKFDNEAQEYADSWRHQLEKRLCKTKLHPIMEAHLSKYRSLMPSLALVFQVIEVYANSQSSVESVGPNATKLAMKWCELLEHHMQRACGEEIRSATSGARHLLRKIKQGKVKDYDRCRDIYRRGWKELKSADALEDALKVLEEHGMAKLDTIRKPMGAPSDVIRVHPDLMKKPL